MYKRIASYFRSTQLPPEVKYHKNRKGKILLHIGDIPWKSYPYIMKMIRQIKPDILVHTGDMVDNRKVRRKPEDIPYYKKQAPKLIECMEKYAEEVYIVLGNNDIEDFLTENVTKTKIVKSNTIINKEGIDFLLSHAVMDINGEAKIYLYGHGPTGDNHSFDEDGKYYCNAFFAPTVVFMDEARCIRLRHHSDKIQIKKRV